MSPIDATVKHSLFRLYRTGDFHALAERAQHLLTAHPGEPLLHSLRGAACLETGDFQGAIESYQNALTLRPGMAKLHNSLGVAYLRANRPGEAMRSFDDAMNADPQFAEPHFNQGLILENQQRPSDAAERYRRAVQLHPNYCKAWCALAKVRWQLGQFERVAEYYERALAIDATHVPAHRGLLQFLEQGNRHDALRQALSRVRAALGAEHPLALYQDGVLADIDGQSANARKLLEGCRFDPSDPISAHDERLRLARLTDICDRLNDIDAAMTYAAGANRLARQASAAKGIDKTRFLAYIQNRRRYYTQNNIEHTRDNLDNQHWQAAPTNLHTGDPSGVGEPDERSTSERSQRFGNHPENEGLDSHPIRKDHRPVFIIGFPRSGTTLLDSVLRGHPDIAVAEESAAVPTMVNLLCGTDDERLQSLAHLSTDAIEQARRIYFDTLAQSLEKNGQGKSEMGDASISSITKTESTIVDRFAFNTPYAGEIHRIFPNAKFVLMLRHPADAVLSCYLRDFTESSANASFHSLQDAARLYTQVFGLWVQLTEFLPLDALEIKYEDLVADVETTSRKVLAFIDLSWHRGVLDHQKATQARNRIRTASYNQVLQPLYATSAGRWQRYRKHLEPVMPTLEPWIERFAYDSPR